MYACAPYMVFAESRKSIGSLELNKWLWPPLVSARAVTAPSVKPSPAPKQHCNDEPKAQATPVWVTRGHITKSDELKALAVRAGNCLSESYTHYETLELGRGLEPERTANT